jgi:hypothetical protein
MLDESDDTDDMCPGFPDCEDPDCDHRGAPRRVTGPPEGPEGDSSWGS